jgi:hypothetical protein
MWRRLGVCALAFLLCVTPLFAKRRAVTPGAPGHCITGRVAILAYVVRMAQDATHVYWIDDGGYLLRVPRLGGDVEELALLEEWLHLSMAVDETNVYIGVLPAEALFQPRPGSILAVPKNGGATQVLISGVQTPFAIETDATHIYWADVGTYDIQGGSIAPNGRIERALKNGTGRQTLADNLSAPADVLLEGDTLWYGETGLADGDETVGLYRIPKSGGTVTTVNTTVVSVTLSNAGDSILIYGANATAANALFVVAKNGSSVRTLVDDGSILGEQQVADGRAYYVTEVEEGNALWSVPLAGGTPSLLRDDLYFGEDFEVDGCALVFGTNEGELLRIAR